MTHTVGAGSAREESAVVFQILHGVLFAGRTRSHRLFITIESPTAYVQGNLQHHERIPRPLTSKRAQPMYSTMVAMTMKATATLIRISDTPRMP
ncbi:hypothetical protein ACVW0A_003425 [Pseudomonas sp. TE3610]